MPPSSSESLDAPIPFCHRIDEISRQRWRELRSKLVGDLQEGYAPREDPLEGDRFVPNRFLHKEDSIFSSGRAQHTAIDQFALRRVLDFLKEVPSHGLRLVLQSYHVRGALIAEELFDRVDLLMQTGDELVGEVAQEKKAREEAERRVATLEAEKEKIDATWRGELEAKQSTIANLQTHRSKQSSTIHKLKGEIAELKEAIENSQREAAEGKSQVEQLKQQVEAERQEKLSVQENLNSERLALQSLKVELDESKSAHQAALAEVQSIEARLNFLTSEEGKRETIEGYRQGPLGKVELSLAVKTGFDYLKAQLPSDVSSSAELTYPPRVQSCLPVLLGLEERGAGVQLGVSDDDDDDDEDEDGEEDDDDDNDDEGNKGDDGDRS